MTAAGVMYDTVHDTQPGEHVIPMTFLRNDLTSRDKAAAIARVRIHPLDLGTARYTIECAASPDVAYGEYPGKVIDAQARKHPVHDQVTHG